MKWLNKIWGRILCGTPVSQGNYSRYWGDCDEENEIYEFEVFQIGKLRSIFVDLFDNERGSWASHPLNHPHS